MFAETYEILPSVLCPFLVHLTVFTRIWTFILMSTWHCHFESLTHGWCKECLWNIELEMLLSLSTLVRSVSDPDSLFLWYFSPYFSPGVLYVFKSAALLLNEILLWFASYEDFFFCSVNNPLKNNANIYSIWIRRKSRLSLCNKAEKSKHSIDSD